MSQAKAREEVLDAVVDSFAEADAKEARRRELLSSLLDGDSSSAAKSSRKTDNDDVFLFSGAPTSTAPVVLPAVSEVKQVTRIPVAAPEAVSVTAKPIAEPETASDGDADVTAPAAPSSAPAVTPSTAASPAPSAPSISPAAAAAAMQPTSSTSGPLKPSAAAAAAIGGSEKPAVRTARPVPAPAPKAPASKPSFFDSFLDKMADFFDSAAAPAAAPDTRAAAAAVARRRATRTGRSLGRVRTEEVTAAMFEAFAHLDGDKDGFVTKDEAWKHLLRCGHCRVEPVPMPAPAGPPVPTRASIDADAWDAIKDAFELAMSEFPEYLLPHEVWSEVFADIDVDNPTLSLLLVSGRVNAHKN
jgi:hypothetical protein